MRKVWAVVLAMVVLAAPPITRTQTGDDAGEKNAKQARAALDAMVEALGGNAWLNMKNQVREGHIAAFYRGEPDLGTTKFYDFHAWPDHDRIEFTKHRDVVQFYIGRKGREVTYRGAKALPQEQVDEFLRRRDHSIETAVKVWLKDPKTILVYEGQRMAERHLADQVTLISAQNESITIQMDTQTHLPLAAVLSVARSGLQRQEHRRRGVRQLPRRWMGFPPRISISRYKERRDGAAVLHRQGAATTRILPAGFLGY